MLKKTAVIFLLVVALFLPQRIFAAMEKNDFLKRYNSALKAAGRLTSSIKQETKFSYYLNKVKIDLDTDFKKKIIHMVFLTEDQIVDTALLLEMHKRLIESLEKKTPQAELKAKKSEADEKFDKMLKSLKKSSEQIKGRAVEYYVTSDKVYVHVLNQRWVSIAYPFLKKYWDYIDSLKNHKASMSNEAFLEKSKKESEVLHKLLAYLVGQFNIEMLPDTTVVESVSDSDFLGQSCYLVTLNKEFSEYQASEGIENLISRFKDRNLKFVTDSVDLKLFISQNSYLPLGYNSDYNFTYFFALLEKDEKGYLKKQVTYRKADGQLYIPKDVLKNATAAKDEDELKMLLRQGNS